MKIKERKENKKNVKKIEIANYGMDDIERDDQAEYDAYLQERVKDNLIKILSNNSGEFGEGHMIDFLNKYKISGFEDATVEMLQEYILENELN